MAMFKRIPGMLTVALALACVGLGAFPVCAMAAAGDSLQSGSVETTGDTLSAQSKTIVEGYWGTCPWAISTEGVLTVGGGVGENLSSSLSMASPWAEYSAYIRSVVFSKDSGPAIVRGNACRALFYKLDNLQSIDLSGLDTSEATDMSYMFAGCESLASVNLSALNTSNVTQMSSLFAGCTSLKSLTLAGLDTTRVTSMNELCRGCESLETIDLSGLNTSNVKNMASAFCDCHALKLLDMSGLDTSSVTDMSHLFCNCQELKSLRVSGLDTRGVTTMEGMFYGCASLSSLDLSSFDTSSVTIFKKMFAKCTSLTALDISNFAFPRVTTTSAMFLDCSSLVDLRTSALSMLMVLDMSEMFSGCKSLATIDLSGFEAPFLKNVSSLFKDCSSLESLDLSPLDTASVTDMHALLSGCSSLTSIDMSTLDTSSVTDMRSMFANCSSLKKLDLRNFDTSKTRCMAGMFYGCASLVDLDISSFDMTNLIDSIDMIDENYHHPYPTDGATDSGCKSLARISLGEKTTAISLPTYGVDSHINWFSQKEGRWFSRSEIAESRKGIADVYTKGDATSCIEYATATIVGGDVEYNGKAHEPDVEVRLGSTLLDPDSDYTVKYSNNTNAGTARVTIVGKSCYDGTLVATFEITPISLSDAVVTLWGNSMIGDNTWAYAKNEIRPRVYVKLNGKVITRIQTYYIHDVEDSMGNYALSFENNIDPGIATVIVTGMNNYTGTVRTNFTIIKARNHVSIKAGPRNAVRKPVSAKTLAKKSVTIKNLVSVVNANGSVTCANVSETKVCKRLRVNKKTGAITLPKGTKKGLYKVTIRARATGDKYYRVGIVSKVVSIRVK